MEHGYSFISIFINCHVFEVNNKAGQSIVMMEPLNTNNISSTISPPASICFIKWQSILVKKKKCAAKRNKSTNNYLKKLIGGIIQLCSRQCRKVLLITTELNRTFFSLNLVIFQGELLLTQF